MIAAMPDRIALWDRLHELLPPSWRVPSAPSFGPAARTWEAVARGPMAGGRRCKVPPYVIGTGTEALEARRDPARRLPP
jgi:hypothetical protein